MAFNHPPPQLWIDIKLIALFEFVKLFFTIKIYLKIEGIAWKWISGMHRIQA
ncbi:hypothetical protein PITCH_A180013 [uncultured Desulfobacterium sp.]|uniref:Uncharacterized protein n=1 Tax=uncultured Desulfobacterium sp. TaxID=201089 RepID=A0A445MVC9_9BACT|nr:hypothetical protein PITCH_A180013 [uncultured Desulfobacterium sp.]